MAADTLFDESEIEMATAEQSGALVEIQQNPLAAYQVLVAQGADPEKLGQLLALHERWESRQAEKAYWEAMRKCQAEIKKVAIRVDRKNDHTNSWYVQLSTLSSQIDPIILEHGFALSYDTDPDSSQDKLIIVCDCSHEAGHTHRYRLPLGLDTKGPKGGDVKTAVQGAGSTVSYGRRYIKLMIFDITIAGEDNDGNRTLPKISDGDKRALEQLLMESNSDIAAFCKHYHVQSLADLPTAQLGQARAQILRKMERDKNANG